jgi:MerR family redox-sensitive transcriptional activator SoxR
MTIPAAAAGAAMPIGELARRAGVEASAIRYYESEGLIPAPPRRGGKRRYDASALEWLAFIALAREAGFTIAEIRELVRDFHPGTRPAARWESLASRKLAEIDAIVARAEAMRRILRVSLACGCFRLADCRALLDVAVPERGFACGAPAEVQGMPDGSDRSRAAPLSATLSATASKKASASRTPSKRSRSRASDRGRSRRGSA